MGTEDGDSYLPELNDPVIVERQSSRHVVVGVDLAGRSLE
jgi:hypothetical protein